MNNNIFIYLVLIFLLISCGHDPTQLQIEAKYASAPSKFIDIEGTRVHYRDEGSGPTIVLMHGVLSSLHTWNGWTENLKKDHRIIRFDIPAFGLTGKLGNNKYTIENYLNTIELFLKKMDVPPKFVIVGNSLGGLLAWNYAVKNPDRILKLGLIDSAAYPQELPSIMKLMIAPIIRNLPVNMIPKFLVNKNVDSVYGDTSRISKETYQLYFDINHFPGDHEATVKLFQYLETVSNTEQTEPLKSLKMPIMVMWGEKDQWIPFNPRWKNDLPNAYFVTYKGVGHVPMEEIPELSVNDFKNWLNN
jgi:pimeloyl-ACP methyl ester carboxylesterase